MTVVKRHCITLDEITAIQYECKKCGTRVACPLRSVQAITNSCPECPSKWFETLNVKSDVRGALADFIKSISKLNELAPEMGCIFSLEIKGETNGQEN